MKQLHFYKYDGAGNDFVILDIRENTDEILSWLTVENVALMCHRRFGIGADGLMTLSLKDGYDFEMRYYNSDGRIGSMCGNGGRCIVAFAHKLGLFKTKTRFLGFDGPHEASIEKEQTEMEKGVVSLRMRDISSREIRQCLQGTFLDTGSPHYVQWVDDIHHFDVYGEGKKLRNNAQEFPEGTNVDFIEKLSDETLFVRTYERGVEDETWACGTGVTACSIVSGCHKLRTLGGDFRVDYQKINEDFTKVDLIGPVSFNYEGDFILIRK